MGATGEPTLEEIQRAKYILTLSEKEKKELNMLEPIYKTAVSALEKQIPKTPNVEGNGYADGHLVYDTWICPNCEKDYEIDYDDYDYCPNCGQKINKPVFDWGNEDAE